MIHLDHYGLHWVEGDIALLVQQDRVDHVLGIPMEFPVEVKTFRRGLTCPHNIPLEFAEYHDLPSDELVRAMLPLPKPEGGLSLFVEDTPENWKYVVQLQKLSSSKQQFPLWSCQPDVAGPMLQLTNLAPLIVFGYNEYNQITLSRLIQMAHHSPRRLIFLGPKNAVLRPEIKRIEVKPVDLSDIPLDRVGAWHLKNRMFGNAD